MKPKISVIIPVYNGEKYLPRCLDSLLEQSFKDWVAICIDDGSTDSTGKILDKYAKLDKRFIVIHKKNAGVSAARNDGIKKASGDYIHFMDADDVIDENYYKEMIFNSNNADVVCSGFVSNTKYSSNLIYKKKHVVKTLFGKLFWSQALLKSFVWRYLFKTDFIKKHKLHFDTKLISQEDAIFVLDAISLSSNMVIVPNVNYHYMFNETSALNNKDSKHREKLKAQYKIGKEYRKKYAKENKVVFLWYMRKVLKLFF